MSDSIAATVHDEPDLDLLPSSTPLTVRHVLQRCLQRDRDRRLQDLADARLELEDALSDTPAPTDSTHARSPRPTGVMLAACTVVAMAVGAAAAWFSKPAAAPKLVATGVLELALPGLEHEFGRGAVVSPTECAARASLRSRRRSLILVDPVALSATIYNFEIQLTDLDRHVYEALSVRAARHPSESEAHLVTRLLVYCLEYTEGITFSKGLAEPDQPALTVRDLTGALHAWIEVGAPDAARLHRASKAAPRVAVYTHKDPAQLLDRLEGERIHRSEQLELYAVDRDLIAELVARLHRRMAFDLSITDRHLSITIESEALSGSVERFWPA